MADPRFFRVAVEGDTTDGRKITRQDILDCAETFNPELCGVRVNLEHYRSIVPGGPFDMLGDVTAVKAEEIDLPVGSVTQKAMGLFATLAPLPALVEMNKKRQKIFSSVEIGQNCRGTGKAYLVGMAVTDSPASFGTQALEFAAKTPGFYSNRKLAEDNLLCQSHEIPQDVFAAQTEDQPDAVTGLFAKIAAFVDTLTGKPAGETEEKPKEGEAETPPPAPEAAGFATLGLAMGELATAMQASAKAMGDQIAALSTDLAALKTKVEEQPQGTFTRRDPATGTQPSIRTDC